jgi:cysteine desulfurase/selenocysteine lyase
MNAQPTPSTVFDVQRVRADFPLLTRSVHGKPLVYFDNANTSQKPASVIEAMDEHYRRHNANVARAVHQLGEESTAAYEGARDKLARFIHAPSRDELILTSGTTQSINLVAYSYALPRLKSGDAILTTVMEHHANIVPWQLVAARSGATVKAAHGATVGQLDERSLFYLRSRGIPLVEARALLTAAFCRAVLDDLPNEALREHLSSLLIAQLPA